MNSDEWARVQELFEQAAALAPTEREPFLAQNCADPSIRNEVESLLKAEGLSAPLEAALREVAAPVATAATDRGRMIGNYRIVRQIGTGGMGLVYEAEQQNPKRLVAVKVIRGGRYVDEQQVRLFQREAQALARLRHPAIASIFETGRTEDGQHFFAMELVRGERLTDYVARIDRERSRKDALDIKLQLFCRVCEAVTYAHQRGVIHRDLKPNNIIVEKRIVASDSTRTGVPGIKILDFGLARITESDLSDLSDASGVGVIQGSLAYMSPEQAAGNTDEIDLRTDIYSLGVVLYELVAGRLPFDYAGRSMPDVLRRLGEDPPRPVTLSDGRPPGRDLDTIVRKALEREPQNRYQSVASLGGDVVRYLSKQPIIARGSSAVYQLRMLVTRHRSLVGLLLAMLVVMIALAGTMAYQARRIAEERDRANLEAATAAEIGDFLITLFETSDPGESQGNSVTARQLLDRGAQQIERTLQDRPQLQARLMDRMGRVYRSLGLYDRADALLAEAIRTWRTVPAGDEGLATSLFNRAELRHYQDELDEAEAGYKEALGIQRRVLGEENLQVAHTIDLLGRLYRDKGDYRQADDLHERALVIRRRLTGDRSLEFADSLHSLAMMAQKRGDYAAAEMHLRKEFEIYQEYRKEYPALTHNLGTILELEAKYDEAETMYRVAVSTAQRMYGERHLFYANTLRGLAGFLLEGRGDAPGAEPLARQSLAIVKQTVGERHSLYATGSVLLVRVLLETGGLQEAESLTRSVVAASRTPLHLAVMARVLLAQGRVAEADTFLAQSLAQWGQTPPNLDRARTLVLQGRLRLAQGRADDAEKSLAEALRIRQGLLPDHHLALADARFNLGRGLAALARFDEAEKYLLQAMASHRVHLGGSHPWTRANRDALVDVYRRWGKPERIDALGS